MSMRTELANYWYECGRHGMQRYAAAALLRIGPACVREAEACCQGEWPDRVEWDSEKCKRRQARLDRKVESASRMVAESKGPTRFAVLRQHDPRGYTLRLVSSDGSIEIGVPTS
jgi:hypothetical protein